MNKEATGTLSVCHKKVVVVVVDADPAAVAGGGCGCVVEPQMVFKNINLEF